MKITVETIPHSTQRYETVGDYFVEGSAVSIKVSELPDPRYALLVAVHEMLEVMICQHRKIDVKLIDKFDMDFEKMRLKQPSLLGEIEPGDMVTAPYHSAHVFSTKVEKLLARQLGVKWDEYEKAVNQLSLL